VVAAVRGNKVFLYSALREENPHFLAQNGHVDATPAAMSRREHFVGT
jgi:hypothetical protein